jgi:long-chain acyl-CoA synthetase
MPFLNRLQQWAKERPHNTAVVVGSRGLSWAELQQAAADLAAVAPRTSVLAEANSLEFASSFAAAVAGERRCAVLDPTWPEQLSAEIRARLGPSEMDEGIELIDGDPSTPFLVGLTSGTTSTPKAFNRSRRSWQKSFEASVKFFGLTKDDITLAPGPLAASLNLYALAESLYAGSEFHTLESFDVGEAHAAISHDGITRLVVVPTMLRTLSERGLMGCVDASGIRSIISAGSKLDARTRESARRWAPNATIFEYYGASELSFVAGRRLAAGEQATLGVTGIGAPFPGVEVKILDDKGVQLADGEQGNIFVRSGMICDGYLWGDDKLALQRHGAWSTVGDRGYLSGGELHILGRSSDMIVTAGRNVYPHEVELALNSVPGVAAAVVAGFPDDIRGQRVIAGIIPSCGGLTAAALTTGLEAHLPRDKRPLQYFSMKDLPLTDRGKVSRQLFLEWISRGDSSVHRLT